jgi:hypothetical protein
MRLLSQARVDGQPSMAGVKMGIGARPGSGFDHGSRRAIVKD